MNVSTGHWEYIVYESSESYVLCPFGNVKGFVGILGGTARVGLLCLVFHPHCLISQLI